MSRPRCLIVIVGTHTDIGKTWVARELLTKWRALGLRVAARKPVQSFEANGQPTDAEILAAASGEDRYSVCPAHRWYPQAMAPPMAADVLGRPRITLRDVAAEIAWPDDTDVAIVETVGGVRSPLAHDGDSVDLVRALQPDRVVLVADAVLGTLDSIRLALDCLRTPAQVFLNRFDPGDALHRLNLAWLAEHDRVAAVTSIEALAHIVFPRHFPTRAR